MEITPEQPTAGQMSLLFFEGYLEYFCSILRYSCAFFSTIYHAGVNDVLSISTLRNTAIEILILIPKRGAEISVSTITTESSPEIVNSSV
jgi:hypothetical protein